jgi:hypothetical protein
MKRKIFYFGKLFLMLLLHNFLAFAQNLGGQETFSFLRIPQNAKTAAMGGLQVSAPKGAGMFMQNPASIDSEDAGTIGLNYTKYYADIAHLNANYTHTHKKYGEFATGIQYLNYGTIQSYDAAGNAIGQFSAQDYALFLAYSKKIRVFRLGMSLKYVNSSIGAYSSSGILGDIGGIFAHPKQDFTIGLVIKNIGFAFSNYTDASRFVMPFDVQLGTSFKPKKMPLRFTISMHHLYPTDITYNDKNSPTKTKFDAENNPINTDISFFDKLSRRFVLATEIIFHTNFQAQIGYNFLQRRELGIQDQTQGTTGISFGAMLKIKGFQVQYAYNSLHIAGGLNTIGICVDTKKIFAKTSK